MGNFGSTFQILMDFVLAKENGILIVDNTLGAGGALIRPIDFGADVVVESKRNGSVDMEQVSRLLLMPEP